MDEYKAEILRLLENASLEELKVIYTVLKNWKG